MGSVSLSAAWLPGWDADQRRAGQVVIFVKSVLRAKELNKLLVECNFPSICIHRGMKQEERCAPRTCSDSAARLRDPGGRTVRLAWQPCDGFAFAAVLA